jgi:branched-subunit amino acid ABC-type transport system permease component
MYVFAVRPFVGNPLGWIGATAAAGFAIEAVLAAVFRRDAYALPDALPFGRWQALSLPGGASISPRVLFVLAIGVVTAALFGALLVRSRFGLALTAIASDADSARLVGVPVERLVGAAFALAGTLAAVAGLIGAPDGGSIGLTTGSLFGLKGMAAVILGGFVDLKRVYVAALLVGVVESGIATLIPDGAGVPWRDIAPLLAALAFLLVRIPAVARESLG